MPTTRCPWCAARPAARLLPAGRPSRRLAAASGCAGWQPSPSKQTHHACCAVLRCAGQLGGRPDRGQGGRPLEERAAERGGQAGDVGHAQAGRVRASLLFSLAGVPRWRRPWVGGRAGRQAALGAPAAARHCAASAAPGAGQPLACHHGAHAHSGTMCLIVLTPVPYHARARSAAGAQRRWRSTLASGSSARWPSWR